MNAKEDGSRREQDGLKTGYLQVATAWQQQAACAALPLQEAERGPARWVGGSWGAPCAQRKAAAPGQEVRRQQRLQGRTRTAEEVAAARPPGSRCTYCGSVSDLWESRTQQQTEERLTC